VLCICPGSALPVPAPADRRNSGSPRLWRRRASPEKHGDVAHAITYFGHLLAPSAGGCGEIDWKVSGRALPFGMSRRAGAAATSDAAGGWAVHAQADAQLSTGRCTPMRREPNYELQFDRPLARWPAGASRWPRSSSSHCFRKAFLWPTGTGAIET